MIARTTRICPTGEVFHLLNQVVARLTIFEKLVDDAASMRVVQETREIVPRSNHVMVATPNHWHIVVRPERSGYPVPESPGRSSQIWTSDHGSNND